MITERAKSATDPLSRAQYQVFALIGAMMSAKEIARHIGSSPRTVESHTRAILRKMAVPTRLHVFAAWHKIGQESIAHAVECAATPAPKKQRKPRKIVLPS